MVDDADISAEELQIFRDQITKVQHEFDSAQQETNQLLAEIQHKNAVIEQLAEQVHEQDASLVSGALKSITFDRHVAKDSQVTSYGEGAFEHRSPSNVLTLIEGMEHRNASLLPDERIDWVWALEFTLPHREKPHVWGVGNHHDNRHHIEQREISHELWVLAERMWACDLHCKYVITADDRRIILLVGATHELLVKEAHEAKIPMRILNTRGHAPFHEDLTMYMARNYGGLNEFDLRTQKWLPRKQVDPDSDEYATNFDDKHYLQLVEKYTLATDKMSQQELEEELRDRGIWQLGSRFLDDEEEKRSKVNELRQRDHRRKESQHEDAIFTTAIKQRLVRRRISHMCGIDLDGRLRAPSAKDAIDWVEEHATTKRTRIRSKKVHDMLTAVGGYRPNAGSVFPLNAEGISVVTKLAKQCLADPEFVLRPDKPPTRTNKLAAVNLDPVTYEELSDAVTVLKQWIDPNLGPGRNESFVGTFRSYYPLHNEKELAYLRAQWGTFKVLTKCSISGYSEGDMRFSFSHPENTPMDHIPPWSWNWQPINEIRDYFGEDCGLYQAWLSHYTGMLLVCMIFGLFVFFVQPYYGGVDKNPFTVAYSIYVGMWSVSFLEGWKRKEEEYRFLWNSANIITEGEDDEGLRPEFIGEMVVTESGREKLVYSSWYGRAFRLVVSATICALYIFLTLTVALAASTIRTNDRPGTENYCALYPEMCCSVPECCLGKQCCAGLDGNPDAVNTTCCTFGCTGTNAKLFGVLNDKGVPTSMAIKSRFLDNGMCNTDSELKGGEGTWSNFWSHPCGHWQQKRWQYASSALNLFIIESFGMIYAAFAERLTEFENHRTEAEHSNASVVKMFVFQFLNNYFLLFYIAFLRDWVLSYATDGSHLIASSTLPELQEQMMIVFTGKTISKQITHCKFFIVVSSILSLD